MQPSSRLRHTVLGEILRVLLRRCMPQTRQAPGSKLSLARDRAGTGARGQAMPAKSCKRAGRDVQPSDRSNHRASWGRKPVRGLLRPLVAPFQLAAGMAFACLALHSAASGRV